MSEQDSPYRSPKPTVDADLVNVSPIVLRAVRFQRWVFFAFLGNLVLQPLTFGLAYLWNYLYNSDSSPFPYAFDLYLLLYAASSLLHVVFLILSVIACFALIRLLSNRITAFLVTWLMLIPYISIVALLVVNHLGILYLRQRGILVGMSGLSPGQAARQLTAEFED